jgi:uncharacterized membrane protein
MRQSLLSKYMIGAGIVARGDRKPRFFGIILIFLVTALAMVPAYATAECTIYGNVYDWATFSTVDNAVVKVYSLPDLILQGNVVARTGSYSFSLPGGDYMIVASAGTPGTPSEVTASENITRVPDSGERIIDLILFPSDSLDDLAGFTDTNATPTLPPEENPTLLPNPTEQPSPGNWALLMGGGAILLAVVAIIAGLVLLRMLRPKKAEDTLPTGDAPAKTVTPPATPPVTSPVLPPEEQKPDIRPSQPVQPAPVLQPPTVQDLLLPEDCRQVLAIIEKNDGRITQLDLRKMLPYSEAKVSLIVSDLESRGLVKKIKKGRGNVLILNRSGDREGQGPAK